jgi:hypothetical protein
MKYGKKWRQDISELPTNARQVCIHYKCWKERIANCERSNWSQILEEECMMVDKYIFEKKFRIPFLCCGNMITPEAKLKMCEFNTRTLYKVCKKLDKKLQVPAMEWYTHAIHTQKYKFVRSSQRTYLELVVAQFPQECPICLCEDIKTWVIMRCGHYFCIGCIIKMWRLHTRGTVHNILLATNLTYKTCPICQVKDPICDHIVYAPRYKK